MKSIRSALRIKSKQCERKSYPKQKTIPDRYQSETSEHDLNNISDKDLSWYGSRFTFIYNGKKPKRITVLISVCSTPTTGRNVNQYNHRMFSPVIIPRKCCARRALF